MLKEKQSNLSVAVGIATSGRAETLAETLADLQRQTSAPAQVLVLYGKESDVAGLPERFPSVQFSAAMGGLCAKRNRILDQVDGAELVLFIDDDFLLHPDYLRIMQDLFLREAELVAATGRVLADGAKGPGLPVADGRKILVESPDEAWREPHPTFNTYGCNMVFRMAAIRANGTRFDEKLPAYAWYEDVDFSRRLARCGKLLLVPAAKGVHLGTKAGRQSGRRLGYSQVANPAYLWRKGTFPLSRTLQSAGRHLTINLFRSFAPEPFVDRRGRLRGNLEAVHDLLRGRMHPERISEMP